VRQRGSSVPADRWREAIDDRLRTLVAEGRLEDAAARLEARLGG
jgi:hypothetical protein